MATLTAQTKLTVSDIVADDIALDISMTPSVIAGGITSKTIDVRSGAATEIIYATHYNSGTIVYLRNMSGTETATIELTGGTEHIVLGAYQWAVFPWKAATDMKAFSSASLQLEIGIFSAA